jgi:acetoacetyl-CoA synthetase
MDAPLWRPDQQRVLESNMVRFMNQLAGRGLPNADDYAALYRFSLDEPAVFWRAVADFAGIVAETWGERGLVDGEAMPGARFFPDARLNFAANCLRRRDDGEAIVFRNEAGLCRTVSWRGLHEMVGRIAAALTDMGVRAGDRVAGFLPNLPETVAAALAAASIGAIWSSCSPDFGADGVVDRFGQITPRVLFAADGYVYAGKRIMLTERLAAIARRLPSVQRLVVIPYLEERPSLAGLPATAIRLDDWLATTTAPAEIPFAQVPFHHPLYILYSSGTTGVPKCIVHGAGGTLLQHVKEHQLHCDIRAGDRVFYFTTCGWMMWNWLVTALASQATLLLYDGSPFHPAPRALFDLADAEGMTLFGTSAKMIDAWAKARLSPKDTHRLDTLRTMTSTGSPLSADGFDYVYREIKADLHLASIAGGTDLISCFVLGNPIKPVWRGEIQGPGLGMAVDVFDADGRRLADGQGELVCTRPFPTMPLGFWNDGDGSKYRAAYFERFPGIWHHGDFVSWTHHGGIIIFGRSDATLNPGGVRIGTAEIYRQVERFDEVVESLAVGQDWRGDVRIVLFVVLRPGVTLDDALVARIRDAVRSNCSPRHVPAKVLQVADIPRTKSGKITELAVRDIIHRRPVTNTAALANPDALAEFRDRPELQT